MLNYLMTLAQCKMSKKGALFVEYALILAFVVIVGTVLISGGEGGTIGGKVEAILNKVIGLLGIAESKAPVAK